MPRLLHSDAVATAGEGFAVSSTGAASVDCSATSGLSVACAIDDFIADGQVALEVKLSVTRQDLDHLQRRVKGLPLSEQYIISLQYSDEAAVIVAPEL